MLEGFNKLINKYGRIDWVYGFEMFIQGFNDLFRYQFKFRYFIEFFEGQIKDYHFSAFVDNHGVWWNRETNESMQAEQDAYFEKFELQKIIKQCNITTTRRAL